MTSDGEPTASVYAGKALESREFTVTQEFVRRYMAGVGTMNSWYHESSPYGRPIAPAAILYFGPARLKGWSLPGARKVRNTRQQWSFHGPVFVGETLTLRGQVIDRYVQGDRDHVVHEMVAVNELGKEVCRGSQTTSWLCDDRITPAGLPRRD